MALDSLTQLRRYIDDPDKASYPDTELSDRLDAAAGSLAVVARDVWQEKLVASAGLVNVSEGGSSRGMSVLYDRAKEMLAYWQAKVDSEAGANVTIQYRISR